MNRIPRFPRLLLKFLLPEEISASAIEDIARVYRRDVEKLGPHRARMRVWREVFATNWLVLWRDKGSSRRWPRGLDVPVGRRRAAAGVAGDWVLQDAWFALRTLAKEPGWTASTLATLALGIGAATAIFTVVNGVLLRPLAFPESDRLMVLEYRPVDAATVTEWSDFDAYMSGHMRSHVTYPSFEVWRGALSDVFSEVGAYDDAWTYDVGFGPEAGTERLAGSIATAGLFRALGVRPLRGRLFSDADDEPGAEPAVLLSYGLWMRRFGGSPDILGQTVAVRGSPHTVVGVMPPEFVFPSASAELWISMAAASRGPGSTNYQVVGRIGDDIAVSRAHAATEARVVRIPGSDGEEKQLGARLVTLHSHLVGDVRPVLLLFVSAVAVLLLIACVNVVNLMLTRATRRAHERVVRAALGASPARLSRLLLTESVVVSTLGAFLGLAMAYGLVSLLLQWAPDAFPRQETVGLDATVLLFSLGLAVLVGIVVGIAPAVQASRSRIRTVLYDAARGSSPGTGQGRLRDTLVVLQLALALIVLVGGGLLIRSLAAQLDEETGFNAANVLTFSTSLPRSRYVAAEDANRFYDRLLAEVRSLPGVRSAAAVTYAPATGFFHWTDFEVEGYVPATSEEMEGEYLQVTPSFFATMGMTILEGRDFDERDDTAAPQVVAVSESLARSYFPDGRALGGRIRVNDVWRTVVAVIDDVWYRGGRFHAPVVYEPYAVSNRRGGRAVMLRTTGRPELLASSVQRLVASLDPEVAVYGVLPLEALLWQAVSGSRLRAVLVGAFAATSLLLAVVGVYGVMTYAVGRRTREMGIRRVLGARPQGIVRHVTRHGLAVTVLGIAMGITGSVPVGSALRSYLYQLEPNDPATLALAVTVLAVASTLACLIPALRASRVDPMVALRSE